MLGRKSVEVVLLTALASCFELVRAVPVPQVVRTPADVEPRGPISASRSSPHKPPPLVPSCKSLADDPTTLECTRRPAPQDQSPKKRQNTAAGFHQLGSAKSTKTDGPGAGISTAGSLEALTIDVPGFQDVESKSSERPDRTPMHQEPEDPESRPWYCQFKNFSTNGKPRKNAKTCPTDQPSQWYRFADSLASAPATKSSSPSPKDKPSHSSAKQDDPRYLSDGSTAHRDDCKASECSTAAGRKAPPRDKWQQPCDHTSASMETGPPHQARHGCNVDELRRGPREAKERVERRAVWDDPSVLHQPPSKHVLPIDRARRRMSEPSADVSKPFMRDAQLARRAPVIDNEQYYDDEDRNIPSKSHDPAPQRNLQGPDDCPGCGHQVDAKEPPPCNLNGPHSHACHLTKRDDGLEEGQWNPGEDASEDGGKETLEANGKQGEGNGEDEAQGAEPETSDSSEGDRTSATTTWIAPDDGSSANGACGVDYNAGSHGACVSPELSDRCGRKVFAYTGDDGNAPKASTLLTVVDTCDELGSDGLWVTKDAYGELGGGDGGEIQNVNWKFIEDEGGDIEETDEGDKEVQKGEQQEEEKETGGPASGDHIGHKAPQPASPPTEPKTGPPADSQTPVPPYTPLPSPSEPQPPADTGHEGHEGHEGQPGMPPLGHDTPTPTPEAGPTPAMGPASPQGSEAPKPSGEGPPAGVAGAEDDLGLGLTPPEDAGGSTETEIPGEKGEGGTGPFTSGEHPPGHGETPTAGADMEDASTGVNGDQSAGAKPGGAGGGGEGDHAEHEGHHMP